MGDDTDRPDRRAASWTLETLHFHLTTVMDERDRRYQERFAAQERAVEVALDSVNKEFHEHVQQVREETTAALNAANLAVAKAEVANEKRFEASALTQATLAATIAGLMPREEFDRSNGDLAKRLEDLRDALSDKLDTATRSLETKITTVESKVGGALG